MDRLVNQAPKEIFAAPQARVVPRIIARIARREPATVEDVRFAKAHTARPDQDGACLGRDRDR